MARFLMIFTYIAGGVGVAVAFYYVGSDSLLAVVFDWRVAAMAVAVLGYACYLLQAAVLNGRRYFGGQSRTPARLWGSSVANADLRIMVGSSLSSL